jgi:hypothetical protein
MARTAPHGLPKPAQTHRYVAARAVAGWRSPLVVGASAVSAAALGAIVQTPGVSQFFGCRPVGPVGWATGLAASGIGTAGALAASRIAERVWPDSDRPDNGEPVAQEPLDEPEPSMVDNAPSRTRRGEEQP